MAKNNNKRVPVTPPASASAIAPKKEVVQPWQVARPAPQPKEDKQAFILGLLEEAGTKGITWPELQAQLKAKFGMAPKKRHSLYVALQGRVWHKVTGAKGQATYFLSKAPKTRARKKT